MLTMARILVVTNLNARANVPVASDKTTHT